MLPVRLFDLHKGILCSLPCADVVPALGNFDGVHSAHRALLFRAARIAKRLGCTSAAWCFDPPSSVYLSNGIDHLSTTEEKLAMFAECGLDYAFLADFPALRELSSNDFIENILKRQVNAVHIVCGFHFLFGKNGSGNTDTLRNAFGTEHLDILPPICLPVDGIETVISASSIRASLTAGKTETATRLLGRPYSLSAPVVHGKALGRTIGIPTINQAVPKGKLMPMSGVYVTRVQIGHNMYTGVTNVGHRPTVDGKGALLDCETHVLGVECDLYGRNVTVEFLHRLRDEQKFDSLDDLKSAMLNDIAHTIEYSDK